MLYTTVYNIMIVYNMSVQHADATGNQSLGMGFAYWVALAEIFMRWQPHYAPQTTHYQLVLHPIQGSLHFAGASGAFINPIKLVPTGMSTSLTLRT